MKKLLSMVGVLGVLTAVLLQSACTDTCKETYTYTNYIPVYKNYSEFRQPITAEAPHALTEKGKIYYKSPYLYIVSPDAGVHIFDDSDKTNPQNIGFIPIQGCNDIAIRNNTLYADNYTDLLAIDISTPLQPSLQKRVAEVFNSRYTIDPNQGVLVKYDTELVTQEMDCNSGGGGIWLMEDAVNSSGGGVISNQASGSSSAPTTGVGGSMARFTIPPTSNYLYIVAGATSGWSSQIDLFDISTPANPIQGTAVQMGQVVETIYPFKNMLMIGTQTGMAIYDISTPAVPQHVAWFEHAKACDPVVADGDYAYVTLREGTNCGAAADELIAVDISNIYTPTAIRHYPMTEPYGLGIDNTTLFVCDGKDGLKIYDATDRSNITDHLIKHYKDIQATDVIPYNDVLMMIGDDGFYQYDYSDLSNIQLLSKISVE